MQLSTMRSLVLGLVVGAVVAASALPAVAQSTEKARLERVRGSIAEVRKAIEAVEAERGDAAQELSVAAAEVDKVLEAVTAAELAVQRQEQAVENARRELVELEAAARERAQTAGIRAASIYRSQSTTTLPLATVLSAGSFDEAVARSAYIEVVSRGDRAALEDVTNSQRAVANQRELLEAEEAIFEEVAEEQRQLLAEVEELRHERALVLADVDGRLSELQAQERHLESESRELAALIRRAEEAAAAAAQPSRGDGGGGGQQTPQAAAGGWLWPARGTITSEFGQRWGRMHEGIDIGASTGTPVVAARAGTVAYVGRQGGYGNLVLVSHGDGLVTAYAHLNSFSVSAGQSVSQGQQLGGVGCTGTCTGPHLHFEIRQNGTPRNPRSFLG